MSQQYEAPEVTDFGTVTDLTQVGGTNPGADTRGGSVSPPGL